MISQTVTFEIDKVFKGNLDNSPWTEAPYYAQFFIQMNFTIFYKHKPLLSILRQLKLNLILAINEP